MPIPKIREYGPRGLADVKVLTAKLRITMSDGDAAGETFDIPLEAIPEEIRGLKLKSGRYMVSMNKEMDTVTSLTPPEGSYRMKFVRFLSKKGEPPSPVQRPGGQKSWGYQDPFLGFTALYRIISPGQYEGLVVPTASYLLRYIFRRIKLEDGYETGYSGEGSKAMDAWLAASGIDVVTETIPWSDNVLPWLERRILDIDRPISGEVKGGVIKHITKLPD